MLDKYQSIQGCGKIPYDTRSEANAALKYISERKGRGTLQVYKCLRCKGWHLGRSIPSRRGIKDDSFPYKILIELSEASPYSTPIGIYGPYKIEIIYKNGKPVRQWSFKHERTFELFKLDILRGKLKPKLE